MTTNDVKSEIERRLNARPEEELADLLTRLRATDSGVAFRALFPFAAHSQDRGPAAGAAWLLRRVNPKCPISCREAIQEMLGDWDVSIEEVPFYLAEQFGVATVRETVAELRTICAETDQVTLLDTIEYWLRCHEETGERQHGAS